MNKNTCIEKLDHWIKSCLHECWPFGFAHCWSNEVFYPLESFEKSAMAHMVQERQLSFQAGRTAAKKALEQLGVEACGIDQVQQGLAKGAPMFPVGIQGSISHTKIKKNLLAVALCIQSDTPVGLDIQVIRPVTQRFVDKIMTAQGCDQGIICDDRSLSALVCFSIQESVFKAVSRCAKVHPHALKVHLSHSGAFTCHVSPAIQVQGHYLVLSDLVASVAWRVKG